MLADRGFLLLLAGTLAAFANYAPLLSVVPLWAADGGAETGGVGWATGVTMAGTVAAQLCMGRLVRRFPLRVLFAAGALVLGLPTLAYAFSSGLDWVLAVSAVRGVGFGVVAVAGSALVAELVPEGQRGRAVGWYGVAVGLPQVCLLPLAVWCSQQAGFVPVFVVTGVLSALAAPLALKARPHTSFMHREDGRRRGVRAPDAVRGSGAGPGADRGTQGSGGAAKTRGGYRVLAGPWLLLVTAACALGGVTSFLPLALALPSAAPVALFVLSAAAVAGRWAAGVYSDRRGTGQLFAPCVIACAAGMAGLALATRDMSGTAAVAVASAAVYGIGFGALQNDTLVVMFERAGPGAHGQASTAWNTAYDAGAGLGSVAVGLLAQGLQLQGAFLVTAAAIVATVPQAWRERPGGRGRAARGGKSSGAAHAGGTRGGHDSAPRPYGANTQDCL